MQRCAADALRREQPARVVLQREIPDALQDCRRRGLASIGGDVERLVQHWICDGEDDSSERKHGRHPVVGFTHEHAAQVHLLRHRVAEDTERAVVAIEARAQGRAAHSHQRQVPRPECAACRVPALPAATRDGLLPSPLQLHPRRGGRRGTAPGACGLPRVGRLQRPQAGLRACEGSIAARSGRCQPRIWRKGRARSEDQHRVTTSKKEMSLMRGSSKKEVPALPPVLGV